MSFNRATLLGLTALALGGWIFFVFATWVAIAEGPALTSGDIDHVDWHVYDAGARDLADRTLYRHPLHLDHRSLSSLEFNLPPMSAAVALPLAWLPIDVGAVIWQLLAAASLAVAIVLALAVVRVPYPWLWAGLVAAVLSVVNPVLEGLDIGTNNYLVLGLVALFAFGYLRRRDSLAWTSLAAAISLKVWPALLLVMVIRDRRWRVAGFTIAAVALQGLLFLAWLGPDVIPAALQAAHVSIKPIGTVLGPSGWPATRSIWNAGLNLVVALLLVAVPARGAAAIGLGVLAGLATIVNLWGSYLPSVVIAAWWVAAGVATVVAGQRRHTLPPQTS
jgi:hypothetical protein